MKTSKLLSSFVVIAGVAAASVGCDRKGNDANGVSSNVTTNEPAGQGNAGGTGTPSPTVPVGGMNPTTRQTPSGSGVNGTGATGSAYPSAHNNSGAGSGAVDSNSH